jgi:PAS domain S-box-containing protein
MPDAENANASASPFRNGKRWLFLIGFLALGLTALLWVRELHEEERRARTLFQRQTVMLADGVEDQVNLYVQLMYAAAGMQQHAPHVLREEWRRFVDALDIDRNYPGISGIGLVRRLSEADKHSFVAKMREELPEFEIFPERNYPEHYVNFMIEPERAYRAIGFDLASRDERKQAAELARDSGSVAITAKTSLITPGASGSDMLMFLPLYRGGKTPGTVQERRQMLWGWVAIGLSIPQMMRTIHEKMGAVADLAIYDGLEKKPENLVFSAQRAGQTRGSEHYRTEIQRMIGGRVWLIDFVSHSDFEDTVRTGRAVIVMAVGVVATFLVALSAWVLLGARARAESEARRRLEAMEQERGHAVALLSASPSAILTLNGDYVIERANVAASLMAGKSAGDLTGKKFDSVFVPDSDRSTFGWSLTSLRSDGSPIVLEMPHQRSDGRRILNWTFSAVREHGKPVRHFVAAGIDVTSHRHTEEILKAERALFLAGPVVVFRWRAESGWPVEYVSPNVSQFGCSSGALMSGELPYMDLIHPDDLGRVASEVARFTSQGGDAFEQKYRLVRPSDGEVRWVDDRTLIERDDLGKPVSYLGYLVDVTEREKAEEARRSSEKRFSRVLEMSSEGYWEVDADWHTVAVNPALLKMLEVDERQILGRTPREFVALGWESRMEAIIEECKNAVLRSYEMSYRARSGRIVHARVNATTLFDKLGHVSGSYGLLTDITAEKQTEEALKSEQGRLRMIVDSVPLALVISKIEEAVVISANQAAHQMFGFGQDEMTGRSSSEFYDDPEARPTFIGILREKGVVAEFEAMMRRRDGSTFCGMLSARLVNLEGIECVLIGCMDISGRKEAEARLNGLAQELARSNAELEQFAYVASHDLQEPLRMIASYVQLLERRYGDKLDQEAREYIGFSVDGAKRMQTLITDLLEFSRVTRKGNPFVPVQLDHVAQEAMANLSIAVKEAGAKVTIGPMPELSGDPTQLVRLFQNLIGNAIKYRHPSRPAAVSVRAERRGGSWEIRFEDNGIGIAPAYFERIFVIFQRLHTRADYPGTGIGLALCKKIVERHGGQIRVESAEGVGSAFIVDFPT